MNCKLEETEEHSYHSTEVVEARYTCRSDITSYVLVARGVNRYRFAIVSSRVGHGRVYMYFSDTRFSDSVAHALLGVLDRYSAVVGRVGTGLLVGPMTDQANYSSRVVWDEDLLDTLFPYAMCVTTPHSYNRVYIDPDRCASEAPRLVSTRLRLLVSRENA